jgi:hypothetical protein
MPALTDQPDTGVSARILSTVDCTHSLLFLELKHFLEVNM